MERIGGVGVLLSSGRTPAQPNCLEADVRRRKSHLRRLGAAVGHEAESTGCAILPHHDDAIGERPELLEVRFKHLPGGGCGKAADENFAPQLKILHRI